MEIDDIKFSNGKAWLIIDDMEYSKSLNLSLVEVEKQISTIKYRDIYTKFKEIKKGMTEQGSFPPFNYVFFSYLYNYNKVLNAEQFIEEYFNKYKDIFEIEGDILIYVNWKYFKIGLIARMLRAYPSLIRDFHFYLMLVEDKSFDRVQYSCKSDLEGVDIVIEHKGEKYGVSLFVNTNRGCKYKTIKNSYRHTYNFKEIQIPLKLSQAKKCGDICVCGKQELLIVKKKVQGGSYGDFR